MDVVPFSIILVKSDSKGDRLLFRYPFEKDELQENCSVTKKNPYTLPLTEDLLQSPYQNLSNSQAFPLVGLSDEVLSSLFAVKTDLINKKFELKINDVRFVGHPTLLQLRNAKQDGTKTMLIHIVFALQAVASYSLIKCYHDISKRFGIGLRHEEKRCGYVSDQTQIMVSTHDEGISSNEIFNIILEKCTLAQNIKKAYNDLRTTGLINVLINRWIPLSFCLPQIAHRWHLRGKIVEPEDIDRCLGALRPYHSLLLLYPENRMKDFMVLDGSPTLTRMLSEYSPLKNLQTLALDSDLTLNHVFELTAHLVYWAKATVIFPVCATNKYIIAPDAPLVVDSPFVEEFKEAFPEQNLLKVISDFSLPTSLGQKCNPLFHPSQQSQLVQMVIWMLQRHLLLQLHTYIQYLPTDNGVQQNKSFKSNTIDTLRSLPIGLDQRTEHTRTESESGASTISENTDFRSDFDVINKNTIFSTFESMMSFSSSLRQEKEDYQEELLLDFPDEERSAIFKIPATNNPEDLRLFARLCRKRYFEGEHHIEEIMYLENLRRSQILQLLDKFRDVLVTYETEDSAIAMFSYS